MNRTEQRIVALEQRFDDLLTKLEKWINLKGETQSPRQELIDAGVLKGQSQVFGGVEMTWTPEIAAIEPKAVGKDGGYVCNRCGTPYVQRSYEGVDEQGFLTMIPCGIWDRACDCAANLLKVSKCEHGQEGYCFRCQK